MKTIVKIITLTLILFTQSALALPPLWEAAYAVTELNGTSGRPFSNGGPSRQIDGQESVLLGFDFPYGGNTYDRISVDSDGALLLKNDDSLTNFSYYTWNRIFFQTRFSNYGQGTAAPVILPFNTALDQLATGGRVYSASFDGAFNGFDGRRVVITWERSTVEALGPTADITFQAQLFDDGTIVFSYQALTSPSGANWETRSEAGIVIGVSNGDGTFPTGSKNLSNVEFNTNLFAYEIWCRNDDPSNPITCFEPNRPKNNGFDLDDRSIVFNPDGNSGFLVSSTIKNRTGNGDSEVGCDIQLNQNAYVDGDALTADVLQFSNRASDPNAVELKIWLGLPTGTSISFLNIGSDARFVLDAGASIDLGPAPLAVVNSGWPRGGYEFSCRMLDPTTGELLAEERNFFEVQ